LDRAGLVGEDGATHHGVFDIAYLRSIPNMIIYAPLNEIELQNILYTAQLGLNYPIAIRYPRGRGVIPNWEVENFGHYKKINFGKAECLKDGTEVAVLSAGTIGNNVIEALKECPNSETIAHYNFSFIKPLDINTLNTIFSNFKTIITIEDGVKKGGFGSAILEFAASNNFKNDIEILGVPDEFIEHGTVAQLQQLCKVDVKSLINLFSNGSK
jgi:1-deoxy-D-xylulose-5-phosphate synthase